MFMGNDYDHISVTRETVLRQNLLHLNYMMDLLAQDGFVWGNFSKEW